MFARIKAIKIRFTYVIGLVVATVMGGALTATVLASIPDASGVIHGCYRANGSLSIIDSATQNCGTNETALTWNQTGPTGPQGPAGPIGPQGPAGSGGAIGYAHIRSNGSVDSTNSLNVTLLQRFTPQQTGVFALDCLSVGTNPHTAVLSHGPGAPLYVYVVGSGDNNPDVRSNCPTGTNVIVTNDDSAEAITVPYYIVFN